MKLIIYEIKKLRGVRYLWVLLLIMAVACAGAFYYRYEDYMLPSSDSALDLAVRDLAEKYGQDPAYIDGVWNDIFDHQHMLDEMMNAEWDRLESVGADDDEIFEAIEHIETAFAYENQLGYYYDDGTPIRDYDLIVGLREYLTDADGYREHIDGVVKTIEQNLRRIEARGGVGTPAHEYQLHYYELYKKAQSSVDISGISPSVGWEHFFSFDMISVFIYVFLILASGVIFLHERSCGTLSILRVTRGGRIKTAAAKLSALAVMVMFTVLVFTLAVLAVCALMFGFSSPSMPIQAILQYWDCPHLYSLGEFACVLFLSRCLCAFVFACVTALASAIFFSPAVTYAVGAVILTSNLIINYFITYSNTVKINLIGMATANAIFEYSEILTFGHYHSTFLTGIVIFTVIAVTAAAITLIFGVRRSAVSASTRMHPLRRVVSAARSRIDDAFRRLSPRVETKKKTGRMATSSLFVWECRKLLTPLTVAAVILLAAASAYTSYEYYTKQSVTSWRGYEEYIAETWFGPMTDEKEKIIAERCDHVNGIVSQEAVNKMVESYLAGEISDEEYSAYMSEYHAVKGEYGMLDRLDDTVKYLSKKKSETGVTGWLIPTEQLTRLIGRDINIWRLAAVILVFARMYTPDYAGRVSESDFATILYTTKRGRRASFRAKLKAVLLISLCLSLLFEAADLVVGISSTERFLDMLSAPVLSVEKYSAFGDGITIGGFIALSVLIRTVSTAVLALLTCAASFVMKKLPAALLAVAMITLVPYALVYMGFLSLRFIDFTAVLAGEKLLYRSADFAVGGGVYVFAVMLIIGYAALTFAAVMFVRHRTGK